MSNYEIERITFPLDNGEIGESWIVWAIVGEAPHQDHEFAFLAEFSETQARAWIARQEGNPMFDKVGIPLSVDVCRAWGM